MTIKYTEYHRCTKCGQYTPRDDGPLCAPCVNAGHVTDIEAENKRLRAALEAIAEIKPERYTGETAYRKTVVVLRWDEALLKAQRLAREALQDTTPKT